MSDLYESLNNETAGNLAASALAKDAGLEFKQRRGKVRGAAGAAPGAATGAAAAASTAASAVCMNLLRSHRGALRAPVQVHE